MRIKIVIALLFVSLLILTKPACGETGLSLQTKNSSILVFRLVEEDTKNAIENPHTYEKILDKNGIEVFLYKRDLFTENDIEDMELLKHTVSYKGEKMENYAILIKFKAEKVSELEEITATNLNKRMAIIANGRLFGLPIIYEVVSSGEMTLSGEFTKEETEQIIESFSKNRGSQE